jgi:hypothetical protein
MIKPTYGTNQSDLGSEKIFKIRESFISRRKSTNKRRHPRHHHHFGVRYTNIVFVCCIRLYLCHSRHNHIIDSSPQSK